MAVHSGRERCDLEMGLFGFGVSAIYVVLDLFFICGKDIGDRRISRPFASQ